MESEMSEQVQPNERFKDVATVTSQVKMLHCSVNTTNPSIPVSRHQQTNMVSFITTCSQTKTKKLEIRSTQVEQCFKTRSTECVPEMGCTIGVQTKLWVQLRHSYAQTTPAEQEQEEEEDKLNKSVLNVVISSIGHQGEMLYSCLQFLQQLVECKHLELQKQRLEVQTTVTGATQVEPQPLAKSSETRMLWKKPIKVTTLNVQR